MRCESTCPDDDKCARIKRREVPCSESRYRGGPDESETCTVDGSKRSTGGGGEEGVGGMDSGKPMFSGGIFREGSNNLDAKIG